MTLKTRFASTDQELLYKTFGFLPFSNEKVERHNAFYQSLIETLLSVIPEETTWNNFRCDTENGFSGGKKIGLGLNQETRVAFLLFSSPDAGYNQNLVKAHDVLIRPKFRIINSDLPTTLKLALEDWTCTFPADSRLSEEEKILTQEIIMLIGQIQKRDLTPFDIQQEEQTLSDEPFTSDR